MQNFTAQVKFQKIMLVEKPRRCVVCFHLHFYILHFAKMRLSNAISIGFVVKVNRLMKTFSTIFRRAVVPPFEKRSSTTDPTLGLSTRNS